MNNVYGLAAKEVAYYVGRRKRKRKRRRGFFNFLCLKIRFLLEAVGGILTPEKNVVDIVPTSCFHGASSLINEVPTGARGLVYNDLKSVSFP